jgi:hypothetical protein
VERGSVLNDNDNVNDNNDNVNVDNDNVNDDNDNVNVDNDDSDYRRRMELSAEDEEPDEYSSRTC